MHQISLNYKQQELVHLRNQFFEEAESSNFQALLLF